MRQIKEKKYSEISLQVHIDKANTGSKLAK